MKVYQRNEIDEQRWNTCVRGALNKNPYGLCGWLDSVSPSWKGLVIGDYEAVFPIPYRRFILRRRVIQPPFTQQLGLYYEDPSSLSHLPEIFQWLREHFSFGYIQLNEMNFSAETDLEKRKNYKLNYEKFDLQNLSSSHKRNLKKAEKSGIELGLSDLEPFLRGFIRNNPAYDTEIKKHRKKLDSLITFCHTSGMGQVVSAFHNQNLVAAVYLIIMGDTAYYLLPYSTDIGRKLGAMHYLIINLPRVLKDIQFLDFEGSELPGVERFIKGFNAMLSPYPKFKW